jgi:hypothetical protein
MINYPPGCEALHYWPIDTKRFRATPPRPESPRLLIAHAPNHMHFKGTAYLEAAVQRLQKAGVDIELVKVAGVPNPEVMRIFGTVDVVADQFIGGAYGYAALEAMALGKPVLTYVRSPDLVEAADECPLLNATPDVLDDVLLWLVQNRHRLPAIGAQGRAYVERWHSIDAVAERLGRLYEKTGNFPPAVIRKIHMHRQRRAAIRNSLGSTTGWEHPWQVTNPLGGVR